MTGHNLPMSQSTFEQLTKQLEDLRKNQRPLIIEEISQARMQGDLSENAEYHAAKEKQALIEDRIHTIEDKLARAEIINEDAAEHPHIIFGATVEAKDLETGELIKYTLVGSDGINLMENKISVKSPIGKGLMRKKKGDTVVIQTPKKQVRLEIIKFY